MGPSSCGCSFAAAPGCGLHTALHVCWPTVFMMLALVKQNPKCTCIGGGQLSVQAAVGARRRRIEVARLQVAQCRLVSLQQRAIWLGAWLPLLAGFTRYALDNSWCTLRPKCVFSILAGQGYELKQ